MGPDIFVGISAKRGRCAWVVVALATYGLASTQFGMVLEMLTGFGVILAWLRQNPGLSRQDLGWPLASWIGPNSFWTRSILWRFPTSVVQPRCNRSIETTVKRVNCIRPETSFECAACFKASPTETCETLLKGGWLWRTRRPSAFRLGHATRRPQMR